MGGHHRPAVPGIRGDDRRRHSGLGLRLAHAHADALQPVAQAGREAERTAACTRRPSGSGAVRSRGYERSLGWVMDRPARDGRSAALILVAPCCSCTVVPKGFFPSDDTGQLFGTTEAARGHSASTRWCEHQLAARRSSRPIRTSRASCRPWAAAVAGRRTRAGCSSTSSRAADRPLGADDVAARSPRSSRDVPGLRVFISNPPAISIGGRSSKSQYQFTLQSSDIEALYDAASTLEQKLHA